MPPFQTTPISQLNITATGPYLLIEQPGIADASGERLHGPVPADLLDLPYVGALADGSGDEPGPQQVPGKARGIEPAALGAGLDDAGHRVAGPGAPSCFSTRAGPLGPR